MNVRITGSDFRDRRVVTLRCGRPLQAERRSETKYFVERAAGVRPGHLFPHVRHERPLRGNVPRPVKIYRAMHRSSLHPMLLDYLDRRHVATAPAPVTTARTPLSTAA